MADKLHGVRKALSGAWNHLSQGWRELAARCSRALTRYTPARRDGGSEAWIERLPRWGLLAGEVIETPKSIVVNLEMPGVAKEDCSASIENGVLYVRGEKRLEREHVDQAFYLMERAYGAFQRAIPLPPNADPDDVRARFRNGVLRVEIGKKPAAVMRRVTVS